MNEFYVYVYIDPRNLEEFYYGKGKGTRKDAHLEVEGVGPKASRIAEIRKAGTVPIVRVIARGLSESEALLVEATLLWKLGKYTTNIVAGHGTSEHFRPHDSLHRELPGFDFENRLYYFNVGQGVHRTWDDCRKHNFISAGQGARWRDAILGFREGDVFAAYLKGSGYVGIGRIRCRARMVREVAIDGSPLLAMCPNMSENSDSLERSEYVSLVDWVVQVPSADARMRPKAGLFTTTHVRASLDAQPATVAFLEAEFGVNFSDLLR